MIDMCILYCEVARRRPKWGALISFVSVVRGRFIGFAQSLQIPRDAVSNLRRFESPVRTPSPSNVSRPLKNLSSIRRMRSPAGRANHSRLHSRRRCQSLFGVSATTSSPFMVSADGPLHRVQTYRYNSDRRVLRVRIFLSFQRSRIKSPKK